MPDTILQLAEKYALHNAIKFDGKANQGSVISKILADRPELKSQIKDVAPVVAQAIKQISALTVEQQTKRLQEIAPELLEKKEKVERTENLKELEGVDPKSGVIMRFAPSPSGPMHLGHAFTGGLTSLYVKKYGGKFILRIEDTNSDNIDPDAYSLLPEDGNWIFGNVTDVWIQSDRMDIYYRYAQQFIERGAVYLCTCSPERFKSHVDAMQDCPCRSQSVEQNKERWQRMFDKVHGFKEGECVMRFKADMQDKNPAMRDFPLIRINDSPHPRQGTKYRVWPLMNFSVWVDDVEAHMTHIIRAKDHADNAKRQAMMSKAFDPSLPIPHTYFLGRYNFDGLELSCSKTKARIQKGEFWGWDDIRIPFLRALKRRGYQPEAFTRYTALTGISLVDKTISAEEFFKTLNAFNKELIEPIAKHFFFIHDPKEVEILGAVSKTVELRLHPQIDMGARTLHTDQHFLLSQHDLHAIAEGESARLMDCLNFTKKGHQLLFTSNSHEQFKEQGGKRIIHYLPSKGNVPTHVLMPDATLLTGFAEEGIAQLKVGDIVQFERFGYCRLDAIDKGTYTFWFTHK